MEKSNSLIRSAHHFIGKMMKPKVSPPRITKEEIDNMTDLYNKGLKQGFYKQPAVWHRKKGFIVKCIKCRDIFSPEFVNERHKPSQVMCDKCNVVDPEKLAIINELHVKRNKLATQMDECGDDGQKHFELRAKYKIICREIDKL